jgi:bifunctional non-homologous end joining protein LigD
MLSRPGPLPSGAGWSYEVKWDGFRAIVSTADGLQVRSQRGWNMTAAVPELRDLPAGLVLDGELVAWRDGEPFFPLVCRRVLMSDRTVPLTYMIFDVLRVDDIEVAQEPLCERRKRLDNLQLAGAGWTTSPTFDDEEAQALWATVCARGMEGVVAKKLTSRYRPGERGWVKVKNPNYWRRDAEREALVRSRERRARARV